MKPSTFGILFATIMLCIILPTNLKEQTLTGITNQKIKLDQQLDNATDDALYSLIENDNTNTTKLNKEIALEYFFRSLTANLGMADNKEKRELLEIYVPVVLVTDLDGFYLSYSEIVEENGTKLLKNIWTEKMPYYYEDEKAVYSFFLGDQKNYINVYDKTDKKVYTGAYKDIQEEFSSTIFEHFDEYRRKAIISCLTEKMNIYINQHNRIASEFGITYHFALPVIPDTDWDRTIDDVSMFILFQGYPFNVTDVYNRYIIGGARVNKRDLYYIKEQEGKKYYHKFDCSTLQTHEDGYMNKKDCAKEGAFACPICKP